MSNLHQLFERLGLKVNHTTLYELAFTHSSCNITESYKHDYEKLEFIGDAVINFIVASLIFNFHSDHIGQGKMTKMRSELVQKKGLARYAKQLGLSDYIQFGRSLKSDERQNERFLEDVFEAFIGALYLDLGIDEATRFLTHIFKKDIENFSFDLLSDFKSELQEAVQSETREALQYVVVKEEGPSHDKTYTVEVYLDSICLGHGVGKTKKAAEQSAAKAALDKKAG